MHLLRASSVLAQARKPQGETDSTDESLFRSASWGIALFALLGLFAMGGGPPPPARDDPPEEPGAARVESYTSHYLVFGTRNASGRARLLAVDFNRTVKAGSLTYEYKLFLAKGADWSMPVYETWKAGQEEKARRFPSRGGLRPTLKGGVLRRVTATLPDLTLEITLEDPDFPFSSTEKKSSSRTGHPTFTVHWNGTTFRGSGVYEQIRSLPASERTSPTAEQKRRLEAEGTFGLYDWIVLYDEKGRLWHVSQGTLTRDFAYQQAVEGLPHKTHDVQIRWLATAYDSTARQHSPTKWLVDVPAWQMRVRLQKLGEHRGHGPLQEDGTRPIYVQASVKGTGIIQGDQHRFFGMVEHIRD